MGPRKVQWSEFDIYIPPCLAVGVMPAAHLCHEAPHRGHARRDDEAKLSGPRASARSATHGCRIAAKAQGKLEVAGRRRTGIRGFTALLSATRRERCLTRSGHVRGRGTALATTKRLPPLG
jgi:hypothetical protein